MWTWSLNWGEVTPTIVVGTCPMTPQDLRRICDETQVSAVMSLQHYDCLAYWHIDFERMLASASAIALLAKLQTAGHRTYVHCRPAWAGAG